MARYIWHNDQWVPAVRASRPRLFPAIISDSMDALLHPATGVTTDSKSHFRAMTKAGGYEEIGNEVEAHFTRPELPRITDADVAQAYEMVEQGYQAPPIETAEAGIRIL